MVSTPFYNYAISFFCILGLGLSIYAYIVELQVENDSKYVAMCDISEHMSCSKAFKSEYGKGLGLVSKDSIFYKPNSLLGILFYSLTATLAQSNSPIITRLSYWSIFLANLTSLYFAYILYFKLYDFCIVCVSTYVVNILCLILTNFKLRKLTTATAEQIDSIRKTK
ncbi:vitamin K epoxide reductase complex subunit 1-like protein 1 [Tribolium castaneum]|nr:PREDICTED: vitamin K epoxide reductase complex subunit 1-like protein 1 [Tribolium castaneum]|eukprot:XP_008201671.1 PREDICTED: vitamin K epoxide reductase complex subunit 1-like protein 1 [Tribolium castaneum]